MSHKGNRIVREELEKIYGKGCFFFRADCAKRIEELGGIENFKTYVSKKRYKGKPISHRMTMHHLVHRSEGGPTTIENGANVEEIAHQYLHSLPREQEEIVNNMLREFKINCLVMNGKGEIQDYKSFNIDYDRVAEYIEIPAYENTEKDNRKRQKYNRAKDKKRVKEIIEDDLYER